MANINEVEKVFSEKGCNLVQYVNKKTPVVYVCKCGSERKQMYRDFLREKEHSIREYIKGKPASTRKYNWKSADPERDVERSQKYSRKCYGS